MFAISTKKTEQPSDFTSCQGYLVGGVFFIQVVKKMGGRTTTQLPKPTNQEMQNEYNYYLAEQCTRKLLDQGLITIDEFNKIQEKNRRTFSPFLSKILP